MLKFIIKENIKEGYTLKEQIIDSLCLISVFALMYMIMVG